jgi:hypothetical protein
MQLFHMPDVVINSERHYYLVIATCLKNLNDLFTEDFILSFYLYLWFQKDLATVA